MKTTEYVEASLKTFGVRVSELSRSIADQHTQNIEDATGALLIEHGLLTAKEYRRDNVEDIKKALKEANVEVELVYEGGGDVTIVLKKILGGTVVKSPVLITDNLNDDE